MTKIERVMKELSNLYRFQQRLQAARKKARQETQQDKPVDESRQSNSPERSTDGHTER